MNWANPKLLKPAALALLSRVLIRQSLQGGAPEPDRASVFHLFLDPKRRLEIAGRHPLNG